MRAQADVGLADRAIVVANPLPAAEQVDPALHDRVLTESLAEAAAEGIRGGATTPFLLDRFHRRTGGATLDGERRARAPQRRARRADRARRHRMSRIVVAGDVMRDVVATLAAPIARGSDAPAAIAERGGGAGANVAAWLARAGAAVTLIGRVGDDPAGRAAADALRADGVDLAAVGRPRAADGDLPRARRAGRRTDDAARPRRERRAGRRARCRRTRPTCTSPATRCCGRARAPRRGR